MKRTSGEYDPWWDAAERYPAVHIEWHRIAPAHAVWVPSEGVILVDESISQAERRCALAHELAHLDVDDVATELCWFSVRQETNADRLAARRLVDIHRLADVMRFCDDPREVAAELDVTLNVLAIRTSKMHPAERGVLWRALSTREAVA
jgi:Zn-dependent peptidase ImmA (M78 family)